MNQSHRTRQALEEYRQKRQMEKRAHRREKRDWMKNEMEKLELTKTQND